MRVVRTALTFDDVLLIPAHSTVVPREVSLATRLTRGIEGALSAIGLLRLAGSPVTVAAERCAS